MKKKKKYKFSKKKKNNLIPLKTMCIIIIINYIYIAATYHFCEEKKTRQKRKINKYVIQKMSSWLTLIVHKYFLKMFTNYLFSLLILWWRYHFSCCEYNVKLLFLRNDSCNMNRKVIIFVDTYVHIIHVYIEFWCLLYLNLMLECVVLGFMSLCMFECS